jgi:hypothetical protein
MIFTTQAELFKWVWTHRPHYSELSGNPLGYEARAHYFAHVLPKSTYPAYKFSPFNIVLLTMPEHDLFDNQSHRVKNLAAWQWLFQYQDLLRQRYNAGFRIRFGRL